MTPVLADEVPGPSAQDFYERGVAERRAARPDAAIVLLSLAAAREPENADIRLQLALALMAAKRIDAAERELRRGQRLAPGYADIEIALGYIDLFRGRRLQAEARAQRLLRQHPEREDVIVLAERTGPPVKPAQAAVSIDRAKGLRLTRLDGSVSYSRLSAGRAPWREAEAGLSFTTTGGDVLSASFEQASRFDRDDTYVSARYEARFATDAGAFVSAGGSPDATFKPEAALATGGWWTLAANEGALDAARFTASARYAHYNAGDVTSVFLGIESEFWDGDLFAAIQFIGVRDETGTYRAGHLLQLRVQPDSAVAFRCGWAQAPDSSEGRTFVTRTLFAGVEVPLSPQVAASATYAHDELEGLYTRATGTLGISYRLPPS